MIASCIEKGDEQRQLPQPSTTSQVSSMSSLIIAAGDREDAERQHRRQRVDRQSRMQRANASVSPSRHFAARSSPLSDEIDLLARSAVTFFG